MHKLDLQLDGARRLLRVGFGLTAIVAGADKFLNVLTDWTMYLSPVAEALSPVSAQASMHIAGIVEVLVGVALLTPLVQPASYVLAGWLGAIALNLLLTGHYFDIAARDVLLALAAYTLASLTVASRERSEAGRGGRDMSAAMESHAMSEDLDDNIAVQHPFVK